MKSNFSPANIFTDVNYEKFPRHLFNKSYLNSFTCNHGELIPFFYDEVLPGQRIDVNTFGKIQMQPLATATLQKITAYFRYFYVPYRLIWDKWDEFISQDGFDIPQLAPYLTITGRDMPPFLASGTGKLFDMLGINLWNFNADGNAQLYNNNASVSFKLFRHYAYYLIWDTYFRDENLQDKVMDRLPALHYGEMPISEFTEAGTSPILLNNLLPISYQKDYFTTALPWRQKGQPVNLNAYVSPHTLQGKLDYFYSESENTRFNLIGSGSLNRPGLPEILNTVISDVPVAWGSSPTTADNITADARILKGFVSSPIPSESLTTSLNINDLRYSNALQRYLERLALGGNRPAEFYLSMYGVRVDDLRIGQPYYLGGGKNDILVSEVVQQSQTTNGEDGSPQGTLTGNGRSFPSVSINEPFTCSEPGIIMGLFYLRPEINYSQGLDKDLTTFSHLEYPNPVFAHLGEEEVMTSELFTQLDLNNTPGQEDKHNDTIFGYQSRYAWKKFRRNEVHGELRQSLSHWLLSAKFLAPPVLNSDFITVQQDYDIFAVTDSSTHHYIVELYNDYKAEMPLPDFVIPSL